MGIEIRTNPSGKVTDHFFGSYTNGSGRRVVVPLKTRIADVPGMPASLREQGSAAFEVSRRAALDELEGLKAEARRKGRDEGLVRHLIQAKTGRDFIDTPIAGLAGIMAGMKGRKACRSELWRAWREGVVRDFTAWAGKRGLRSALEVTTEVAEDYLSGRAEANEAGRMLTDSTLRRVKAVLGAVFDKALPDGVRNPWKQVSIHSREGSEEVSRAALSTEEVGRLLDVAESDPLVYPLIVTALSTGLRRGDVCRLRWLDVNFKSGTIKVKTSKTKAVSQVSIIEGFRPHLLGWLAERVEGEPYLFPEAKKLLDGVERPGYVPDPKDSPKERREKRYLVKPNPDALTWRVKKVFAQVFGEPQDAPQDAQDAPERVDLGEVLADVRAAVAGATMAAGKRAKMLDLLDAYAAGKSYRDIQAERRISRGAISGLLHEAEELAGVRFLPAKAGTRPSVKEQIQTLTKQGREIGKRSASIYDWHCLRTTFVTHCLFGPKPMTADQVGTITGHSTAKMIHDHYSQPGADQIREKLEAALPARLAKGRGEPKQITQGGAADVAGLAAQLKTLSAADRRAVAKLLKEGGDK